MEKVEDTSTEYQGWDEWATKFKPIRNHLDKYASDKNPSHMFETYGAEYEYVQSVDPKYVWTYVDGDMSSLLVAGIHFVNRIGYYVCEVPWDNDNDSCLLSVETECECYSEDEEVMETRNEEYGDPNCSKCEGYGLVTEYVG